MAKQAIQWEGRTVEVNVYVESSGTTPWLLCNEHGLDALIIAQSFDSALEEYLDESKAIAVEDMPEAYGLETQAQLEQADPDSLNLEQGYHYQPNAGGGTGIASLGHYWTLSQYNPRQR